MARPVTFNLNVVNGAVQSFTSDYLVADDLPRSGVAAAGYDFPYLIVDQYGRIISATSRTSPVTFVADADNHTAVVARAHSATQTANLQEWQDQNGAALAGLTAAGGVNLSGNSVLIYARAFSWNSTLAFNSSCAFTGNAADNTVEFTTGGLRVTQGGQDLPAVDVRPFFGGAATNKCYEGVRVHPQSGGTPAAGFGSRYSFAAQSTTTNDRDVAAVQGVWIDPTDATRTGRLTLGTYYTTTFQAGVRIDSAAGGVSVTLAGGVMALDAATGAVSAGGGAFALDSAGNLTCASAQGSGGTWSVDFNGKATFASGVLVVDDATASVAFASGASSVDQTGALVPAHLADAAAANDTVYFSTTASKLVYKDAGGVVRNLY